MSRLALAKGFDELNQRSRTHSAADDCVGLVPDERRLHLGGRDPVPGNVHHVVDPVNRQADAVIFAREIAQLQRDYPHLGDIRGRGLMLGVELVDPTGTPDSQGHPPVHRQLAPLVQRECLKRGLILELGGRHGSVVRFLPPLSIPDHLLNEGLDVVHCADGPSALEAFHQLRPDLVLLDIRLPRLDGEAAHRWPLSSPLLAVFFRVGIVRSGVF